MGVSTEPDKRRCLGVMMEQMSPVMVALTSFGRRGHGEGLAHRPASGRAAPLAGSGEPQHHALIVGGGFGGLATAQALGSTPLRVTLIDRRNYDLFQPLLYQVATAVLSPGEIAEPIRRTLNRHKNVTVLMGEVEGIDPEQNQVRVNGSALTYDTLVLATGATHSYFGHPEWERFAPGLKTLDDARRIRAKVWPNESGLAPSRSS